MMHDAPAWQPSASLDNLRARAALLARVRAFFAERGVMEVETPLLCRAGATDVLLASVLVRNPLAEGADWYLQTSPEFAMKRLLAAGSGPIYQLCKAFRHGEQGRHHNPEFSMLEWYRPGWDDQQLMDEVVALASLALGARPVEQLSYREAFQRQLGIDPHSASLQELRAVAQAHVCVGFDSDERDTWLDLLISHCLQSQFGRGCFTFLRDYPASQAALARIEQDAWGVPVARRFELYIDGIEIANGYHELVDGAEQARRFAADNQQRRALGLPEVVVDERLLAALSHGMPECAGVALGFDRLLMLAQGASRLAEILSFEAERA